MKKIHNNEVYNLELQIENAENIEELEIIKNNIKDYKNKYKLLHFIWIINDNVNHLKSKLKIKINNVNKHEYN